MARINWMQWLYGILAHVVALRRREIGIRMAIGAGQRQVVGVVLRYGLSVLAAGLVLGGIAAAAAVHWLSGMLFGVNAWDPVTLGVVVAALAVAAIGASIAAGPEGQQNRPADYASLRIIY